ncbi:MAG: FecR domain-containing protein [bacterium]
MMRALVKRGLVAVLLLGLSGALLAATGSTEVRTGIVLTDARGAVETSTDSVKWAKAAKSAELKVGWHVRTGAASAAVINYADGSKVTLGERTQIQLAKADGANTGWNLVVGKIRALVKPIVQGGSHTVETHNAVVGVKGTDFVVWAPLMSMTIVLDLDGQVVPTCKKSREQTDLTPGNGAMCNFDGALDIFQIRDIDTATLVEGYGGGALSWSNWGDLLDTLASGIGDSKLTAAESTMLGKASLAVDIVIR